MEYSRTAYVGVGDKARDVSEIYVGVGNKARTVTAGYVGVGNKAMQFWPRGIIPIDSGFRIYGQGSATTAQSGNRALVWSNRFSTQSCSFTAIGNYDISTLPKGNSGSSISSGGQFLNSDGTPRYGVIGPLPPAKFYYYASIYHSDREHFSQMWIRGASYTTYLSLYNGYRGTQTSTNTITVNEPHYCFLEMWCDDGWANEWKTSTFEYIVRG